MKILVIGDAILDAYCYGQINRMSPEDPSIPVLDVVKEENRLGGCLNVAANIKSLSDYKVDVSSVIPYECAALLSERDIGYTRHSFSVNASKSIKKTRFISIDTNKQLLRLDNRKEIDSRMLEMFMINFKKIDLFYYDCIVISDYNKKLINRDLISCLESFENLVFIDSKKRDLSVFSKLKKCIVKINEKEYNICSDCDLFENLIVTMGNKGCIYYNNGEKKMFPADKVKNVDVVGCGDVFFAGFIVEYVKTNDIEKSIKFANCVAGASVQKFGTTVVSRK